MGTYLFGLRVRNRSEARNQRDEEKTMSDLERNKKTVVAFFTRAYNDHEPDDAVAKHVGSQYIQHNPDTPDGIHRKYKGMDCTISQGERGDQASHCRRRSRGDPRPGPTCSWRPWRRRHRHLSSRKGQDCRTLGRSAARAGEGCQRKHDVLIAVITGPPACRRGTTIRADTAGGTESEE